MALYQSSTRLLLAAALTCMAGVVTAAPQVNNATPGVVVENPAAGVTTITAPDNAIINYNSFDVASSETVNFIQPSAASRVLNRINSATPSQINGTINANGILYFVNPAGVTFGPNAVVDAAGIYAAAGSLSNNDFLSQNDSFFNVTGDVTQHGIIRADTIAALIGQRVTNTGTIAVPNGTVILASGQEVYLGQALGGIRVQIAGDSLPEDAGINQEGTIEAKEVSLVTGDMASLVMQSSLATVAGAPVPPTSIAEIDTDGDGDIDDDDIATAIANLTGALPFGTGGKTRAQGDTDQDGDVDITDLSYMILYFTGPLTPPPPPTPPTPSDPGIAGDFEANELRPVDQPPAVTREIVLDEARMQIMLSQLGLIPRPLIASERLSKAQARALYNDIRVRGEADTSSQAIDIAKTRLDVDVVRQVLTFYSERIAVEGMPARERVVQLQTQVNNVYQQYRADREGFDAKAFAQAVRESDPSLFDSLSAMNELRGLALNLGLNATEKGRTDRQIVNSTRPEAMTHDQMRDTLDAISALTTEAASATAG